MLGASRPPHTHDIRILLAGFSPPRCCFFLKVIDMQTRFLGASELAVSAIGLGCMGMSEFYGPSDDEVSLTVLHEAQALGVRMFDSADTYGHGHNEALLGRFLRGLAASAREQVVVATKFGIVRQPGEYGRRIDNSPGYIRAACEASLQRLRVERIGLYYCHRRDPAVPIEDVVGAMAELVQAGKVAQIGLSEVSAATLRRAVAVHPVAAVQSEYSLWQRDVEAELLPCCAELGVSLVAYSPLGRAFLANNFQVENLAEDDFRRHNPRFQAEAAQANQRLVDALGRFAAARGCSHAQVALAWLLHKHPQLIAIPGARKLPHLRANAAAAELALSAAEVAELDAMFDPAKVSGARYPDAGWAGIER